MLRSISIAIGILFVIALVAAAGFVAARQGPEFDAPYPEVARGR